MNKKVSIVTLCIILGSLLAVVAIGNGWLVGTNLIVSNSGGTDPVYFKYGATISEGKDYPQPPDGEWTETAVSAWRHPAWKRVDNIQTTLYDFDADWIWRVNKATTDEAKTGSVVFFYQEIDIPLDTTVSQASIDITADNAFYLYISSAADGASGPIWTGRPPLMQDGFVGAIDSQTWMLDESGMVLPRPGAIQTDSSVIRKIEHQSLTDALKPGMNWLSIVAVNAQPQPKDKQTSQNTAGLIYKLSIDYDAPLFIPDWVGFTFPLTEQIPDNMDYPIPPNKPIPIQSAWEPDYDEDGSIDLVRYKPATVIVNASGASLTSVVTVSVDGIPLAYASRLGDIFFFENWIPETVLSGTISGTVDGSPLTDTLYEVFETFPLKISYYNLYKTKGKRVYGQMPGTTEFESKTTEFLNATFPVAEVIVDGVPNKGIAGASKGKGRDIYAGLLADAIAAAQDASLRLGGNAIGVAIGPMETGYADYFEYHGFPGAAGISFGPSVKGVVVLDGYWTSVAHEIGHTFGLYWGEPEQYQWSPAWGETGTGVWVNRIDPLVGPDPVNSWSTGLDIMGVGPERTLDDTWITTGTYEELLSQMIKVPDDPEILLASGMIYKPDLLSDPKTVNVTFDWIWIEEGHPHVFEETGNYSLVYTNLEGIPLDRDPVYFDVPFYYAIHPEVGTTGNIDSYGDVPNEFGAFAFATVWREHPDDPVPELIQLWDHTGDTGVESVLLYEYPVGDITLAGAVADFTWAPEPQDEGSEVTFTNASYTWPGVITSWSWDFGDGHSSSEINPTHTYYDDGPYYVNLTVIDDYGFTDWIRYEVAVNNVAPTIDTLVGDVIDENGVATVSGTFSDPGTLDSFTVRIDWGEGIPVDYAYQFGSTSFSETHQYLDDNPTATLSDIYKISVTVTDDDGGSDTDSTTASVIVNNVAPSVEAGSDQTVNEGDVVSFSGSFTDPGTLDTHTIVWSFGDGSPDVSGTLAPTHVYGDNGVNIVTLTVTDDDGGVGMDTLTVTVNNVAPSVDAGPDVDSNKGESVDFTGSFTDPGTLDTHTYAWNFGDGSAVEAGTPTTHIYTSEGTYTVTLTVTDDDGGVGTDTLSVTMIHAWATDSARNDLFQLEALFTKKPKVKDYYFQNTNPGGTMYNIVVDDDNAFTLRLEFSEVPDADGNLIPAFNYQGGNPIHVFSDQGRSHLINKGVVITYLPDNAVEIFIPTGRPTSTIYITIQLDYALKDTSGWTRTQVRDYHQSMQFQVTYMKSDTSQHTYNTDFLVE